MPRSKIFCLPCVVGITVCLVLNILSTQTILSPGALDAAIGVPDTGAQAAENLAILGSPFPDSKEEWVVRVSVELRLLSDPHSGQGFEEEHIPAIFGV